MSNIVLDVYDLCTNCHQADNGEEIEIESTTVKKRKSPKLHPTQCKQCTIRSVKSYKELMEALASCGSPEEHWDEMNSQHGNRPSIFTSYVEKIYNESISKLISRLKIWFQWFVDTKETLFPAPQKQSVQRQLKPRRILLELKQQAQAPKGDYHAAMIFAVADDEDTPGHASAATATSKSTLPADILVKMVPIIKSVQISLSDITIYMKPQIENALAQVQALEQDLSVIHQTLQDSLSLFIPNDDPAAAVTIKLKEALQNRVGWDDPSLDVVVDFWVQEKLDIGFLNGSLKLEHLDSFIAQHGTIGTKMKWQCIYSTLLAKGYL